MLGWAEEAPRLYNIHVLDSNEAMNTEETSLWFVKQLHWIKTACLHGSNISKSIVCLLILPIHEDCSLSYILHVT